MSFSFIGKYFIYLYDLIRVTKDNSNNRTYLYTMKGVKYFTHLSKIAALESARSAALYLCWCKRGIYITNLAGAFHGKHRVEVDPYFVTVAGKTNHLYFCLKYAFLNQCTLHHIHH